MARFWATILKEATFRGTVTGNTTQGYAGGGTIGTDYIIPDIEDQSLTITDTNNAYPIVSYGSNGGVRVMPVVGYSVGGTFVTKMYDEQVSFLIGSALAKRSTANNPLGDNPSLQIDRCYWDSDPTTPQLVADSYKGIKIGQLGITVGATSPVVQLSIQLVGSTCDPITVTANVPTTGKEPDCGLYPSNVYTFKNTSVYADFSGTALYTTSNGTKSWAPPSSKKLITIRSIGLQFQNTLASTSHSNGTLDRIQKTTTSVSYSIVVDLSDPDGTATGDNTKGSQIWRDRYQAMRAAVNAGLISLAVVFDNGTKRVSFDLGKRSAIDGYQAITPIPDVFAAQISGQAMWDSSNCSVFDWDIS